ncbi:MAG: hypothetical protein AAF149_21360 [Bacteroidota bacterium]
MKRTFLFLTLLLPIPALSQQTGTIDYPYLGVKFTIPNGWMGQEREEAYLMGSNTKPGLIALIPHDSKTIQELEQEARMGIQEEGIYLNLSGDLEKFGAEGIGAEFSGLMNGTQVKAYMIGVVNPFGNGLTIVATTDNANYSSQYKNLAQQIASNLQFRAPKEPAKSREWKEWLRGSKLVHMNSNYDSGPSYGGYSTYSSYSTKREILLCSNNQFSYYSSSDMSFDTGGGFGGTNSSDDGRGIWEIKWDVVGNSTLNLKFSNGEERVYSLSYEDQKTYLEGARYFVIKDHVRCY